MLLYDAIQIYRIPLNECDLAKLVNTNDTILTNIKLRQRSALDEAAHINAALQGLLAHRVM